MAGSHRQNKSEIRARVSRAGGCGRNLFSARVGGLGVVGTAMVLHAFNDFAQAEEPPASAARAVRQRALQAAERRAREEADPTTAQGRTAPTGIVKQQYSYTDRAQHAASWIHGTASSVSGRAYGITFTWLALVLLFKHVGFAVPFVIVSAMAYIVIGGLGTRKAGTLSAYGVFNKGNVELPGALQASQLTGFDTRTGAAAALE